MNLDNFIKVAALCRLIERELQQHPCAGIAPWPPRRILDEGALLDICDALMAAAANADTWRQYYPNRDKPRGRQPILTLPRIKRERGRPRSRFRRLPTQDDYTPEDLRLRRIITDTIEKLRTKPEGQYAADHIAAALARIETTKQYFPPAPKPADEAEPAPVDTSQPEITEEEWNEFFNRLPTTPLDKANTP